MHTLAFRSLNHARHVFVHLFLLAPVLAVILMPTTYAAPQVQQRYDKISDPNPLALATHEIGFAYTDFTNPVGSVSIEFCSNSPIPQVVCVPSTGFDATTAVLASQTGQTGFGIDGTTTASRIVLTRAAQVPSAPSSTSTYTFNNVTNPSSGGSHYVRIQTYSSADATGIALEEGGMVFVTLDSFNVSAEVPPYLEFCAAVTITGFNCLSATSYFIDMGEFSKTSAKAASSEMVVAANAGGGFSVTLAGTTLTSGNSLIPPLATQSSSSPGTSQFGLNLWANSSPGIGATPTGPGTANVTPGYSLANQFKFAQGDTVVATPTTSDFRKFTVSYLTNVSNAQPAGVYATTVSFIALANF